jgi:hypothetical protein
MNDYDRRWRRVIFDSLDDMAFQRTDDSFAHYGVFVEVEPRRVTLRKSHSASWQANFTFERPSQDRLVLDMRLDEFTASSSSSGPGHPSPSQQRLPLDPSAEPFAG